MLFVLLDNTAMLSSNVVTVVRTLAVLKERIKVDGKAGNLGDKVSVQKEGEGKISVTSSAATSKRYIKYLCVLGGFQCSLQGNAVMLI